MEYKKERIKALKNCEDMWNWMSANPDKYKFDYFNMFGNVQIDNFSPHFCYCCDFSIKFRKRNNNYCFKSCIINWSSFGGGCLQESSTYLAWENAKTLYLRSSYAKQIAIKAKIARQIIEEEWPK